MKKIIFILLSTLLLGACSSPRHLSSPADFKHQVKGLTLSASLKDGNQVLGEIIEVKSGSILILPIGQGEGIIKTIFKHDISSADIVIASTSNDPEAISIWASLINLAPLGHGYFLVVSVPVNLATTIPISIDAAKGTYRMKYPENVSWDQMYKFARFPQGIPDQIDIKLIE